MARRPGRPLTLLGVLTLIAGLVGALVLVAAASQRRSNAVEGFARAPVGCDTTLDFAEPGEYLVFVERRGSIDEVGGDCDVDEAYDVSGPIGVVVELVDPDGVSIELDRAIGDAGYDVDGFVGVAQFSVDIDTAGDHVMRVESDDGAFAVAIGPDPDDGVTTLFAAAAAAGLAGVVVGLGLIVAGRSRRKRSAAQTAPVGPSGMPFAPVGQMPQGPPTYTQPGGPVNYGRPGVPPPPPGTTNSAPAPSWQPVAPGTPPPSTPPPPTGMPRYEPPSTPSPAAPSPPATPPPPTTPPTAPSIPGEPNWVAPGEQPAAPIAVPIPPGVGPRPDPSSQGRTSPPRPTAPPDEADHDAATARDGATSDEATPSPDESRWGRPPPPT